MAGYVKVGTLNKFDTYALNGDMVTVEDALTKFFGREGCPEGTVLSLNGDNFGPEEAASKTLRSGDVILALPSSRIVEGGVKGA